MRRIANFLAFSSFVVLGLTAMLYLGGGGALPADRPAAENAARPLFNLEGPAPSAAGESAHSPTAVASQSQNQQNILVIGADRIDVPDARLESLWLVIIPQEPAAITLMPLYPAPAFTGSAAYHNPHTPFWFNPQDSSSIAQLPPLANQGVWWDETVIVSEMGLVEIVNLLGGVDLGEGSIDGLKALTGTPAPWEAPQEALARQAALARGLCSQRMSDGSLEIIKRLITLPPAHMQTSLNKFDLITTGTHITSLAEEFDCEFPSLTG
jgi:hypothetical protein